MEAERAAQEAERSKMQAEFESKLKLLSAEISAKQNDEKAKQEA